MQLGVILFPLFTHLVSDRYNRIVVSPHASFFTVLVDQIDQKFCTATGGAQRQFFAVLLYDPLCPLRVQLKG